MGRWPVVEKKKNISNAAKQKVFWLHAKLISLAAQKWGDPSQNPALFDAIEKARKDNVPNDNIERSIKKGTGEDKDATSISQIVYEGYGAGGVAVMVTTLTDNKNRTAANMRHIFTKYGGNMGESGSVGFIFERKGLLFFSLEKYDANTLEELVFETDVEDFLIEEGLFKITTTVEDFTKVVKFFQTKSFEAEFADLDYIPTTETVVDDFDKALKLTKMLEGFREDEDVQKITVNMIIDDKLQQEVDEFIEKNTFRT